MINSRRPPTRMPTTPYSQPRITCGGEPPSVKEKGWDVHELWMTLRVEYVARTYCTLTVSPLSATVPVPLMRFESSIEVGGFPGGTTTVGAFPKTPAGDGSATGAKDFGMVVVVVGAVDVDVVVVVVVFLFPENKSAAVPTTRTATIVTMMPRRMFFLFCC